MKRTERKGQGAMEYLMTYGWAILVVMIVGVVLWQLGIFGGGPGAVNTASGFGKVKPMEPSIVYSAGTTANALSFSLMNGVGQGINGTNIPSASFTGDCSTVTVGDQPGTMGAGEVKTVRMTCGSKTAGQSFSTTFEIVYGVTVAGADITHTETGTIRGVAE